VDVANILTSDFTLDQQSLKAGSTACRATAPDLCESGSFRNDHLGHVLLNLKRLIERVKTMQPYDYHCICASATRRTRKVVMSPGRTFELARRGESSGRRYGETGWARDSVCARSQGFPGFHEKLYPELEANHGLHLWYAT